jgi:hypothetical protein
MNVKSNKVTFEKIIIALPGKYLQPDIQQSVLPVDFALPSSRVHTAERWDLYALFLETSQSNGGQRSPNAEI